MDIDVAAAWETVIGLEVHAQLGTASKMYCACPSVNVSEISEANRYVCPVCLGHPGVLPRPNRQAVVRALTLAQKLKSRINERSVFARKNYFYPDLPKGYQISQYERPVVQGGTLSIAVAPKGGGPYAKTVRLTRAHLDKVVACFSPGSRHSPSCGRPPIVILTTSPFAFKAQ